MQEDKKSGAGKAQRSANKTARKEFGLTQDDIVAAIDAGQLQYRVGVIHGNPWLRLLRREVEELMEKHLQRSGPSAAARACRGHAGRPRPEEAPS